VHFAQLGLSLVAGALTTLSPCVLPILPFVVGGALTRHRLAPVFVALGLMTSFMAIGWPLAAFGAVAGLETRTLRLAAGVGLILAGAAILSDRLSGWISQRLQPVASGADRKMRAVDGPGLGSQYLSGVLLGVVWTPCSGPTLGAAVALAAQEGGGWKSGLMMAFFSVGATVPLIAVAYGARGFLARRRGGIARVAAGTKKVFAALLIVVGLGVLTGGDKWLESQLVSRMPEAWFDLTTRY
jgi:cytochrome c-type biogenesis protein